MSAVQYCSFKKKLLIILTGGHKLTLLNKLKIRPAMVLVCFLTISTKQYQFKVAYLSYNIK